MNECVCGRDADADSRASRFPLRCTRVHVRVEAPGCVELRRLSLGQTLTTRNIFSCDFIWTAAHKPSVHGAWRRVAATSIYTHHLVLPPASTESWRRGWCVGQPCARHLQFTPPARGHLWLHSGPLPPGTRRATLFPLSKIWSSLVTRFPSDVISLRKSG